MKLAVQLLVLGLLATTVMSQRLVRRRQRRPMKGARAQRYQCDEDTEFELITGFVYSSADDIIESNIGALQMSECLNQCRKNPSCLALNFETGLCVLFKTAAGEDSGSLAVSQFPVFTLYAQKICLPPTRPPCKSPWTYETVPEIAIMPSMITEVAAAATRGECANKCLMHERFTCRSASFNAEEKRCVMARVDRNMAGRKPMVIIDPKSDFIELACGLKPDRMCEFQSIRERIMKTVDAVHLDTQSTQECRQRCLDADFGCYSYDFMSAGEPICRLSHHSEATLAHIQEPYLAIENATTFELQACYHVTIECKANEMVAQISTSTIFNGKVYARTRPNSCVKDISNSTDFNITLSYNSVDCDVVQNGPSNFASNIVIQHHDMIVTRADVGLSLHCKYELSNQTVTNSLLSGLEIKSDPETEYIQEVVVASPNVTMMVATPQGIDVISAQVGDNLVLRFEILDSNSPYEIFVRELVALDGRDSSEIVLIDEFGCPTDPSIMQPIFQVVGGKVLHAPFQAFKFPATEVVMFRALVTPCHPHCQPATCNLPGFDGSFKNTISFGKRRRKREVKDNEIMVAQSVRITDKFLFSEAQLGEVQKILSDEECGNSYTGLIIASSLFLLAQMVILMAWSYLWHKKRATKQLTPNFIAPPPVPRHQSHHKHRGRGTSGSSSTSSSTTYLNN